MLCRSKEFIGSPDALSDLRLRCKRCKFAQSNQYLSQFMEYGICSVAAAPVRKEASHRSEMVNQLLFGETMEVLEEKDEWFRIRTVYDQYEGWLTNHLISPIDKTTALQDVSFIASSLTNPIT